MSPRASGWGLWGPRVLWTAACMLLLVEIVFPGAFLEGTEAFTELCGDLQGR